MYILWVLHTGDGNHNMIGYSNHIGYSYNNNTM